MPTDCCLLVRIQYDKGAKGQILGDTFSVHVREQLFSSMRAARAHIRGLRRHSTVKQLSPLSYRTDTEYDVDFLHLVPKTMVNLHRKRNRLRVSRAIAQLKKAKRG